MRAFAAALALVACLTGCAGGGDEDDRLSREEFVQRATAACERAEARLEELGEPATVAEVEAYARDARAATADALEELRALEPPEELADGYERYLGSAEEVVDLLGELEEAAAAGDEEAAREAAEQLTESADAADAARAAGIPECERSDG